MQHDELNVGPRPPRRRLGAQPRDGDLHGPALKPARRGPLEHRGLELAVEIVDPPAPPAHRVLVGLVRAS